MEWKYDIKRKALIISSSTMDDFFYQLMTTIDDDSLEEEDENGIQKGLCEEDLRSVVPWSNIFDEIEIIEAPNLIEVPPISFAWMSNLKIVDLSSVLSVGNSAFYECKSLQSITFPKVQLIGNSAFCGCRSLLGTDGTKVLELRNTRMVASYAFHRCCSLKSVTFKKKPYRQAKDGHMIAETGVYLEYIGAGAFAQCGNLKRCSHGGKSSTVTIGPHAFYDTMLEPAHEEEFEN